MATPLLHRRGNTAQTAAFTGGQGELFVNTDSNQITVHDGVTPGGWAAAKTTGYSAGGFLMANTTGALLNTSPMQVVTANNTIIANTNFTVTGNLTVAGTTTVVNQEIINSTEVVAGQLTANSGAGSTSTSTGALLVNGGAGISGNVFASGLTSNTVQATSINASAMTINSVPVITQTQAILYSLILG